MSYLDLAKQVANRQQPKSLPEPPSCPAVATEPPRLTPESSPGWEWELGELVTWFREHRGRLPLEPFDLHPWARVSEPAKFYAALALDIAAGPRGARARMGALKVDLKRLWILFGSRIPMTV